MGNPAGVPRDFEALEKRRFQAMQMLERGLRQAEIARQLRVVPQTVARWVHDYLPSAPPAIGPVWETLESYVPTYGVRGSGHGINGAI